MIIEQLTADSALWPAYVDYLTRMEDAPTALDTTRSPRPNVYYLAVMQGGRIVGSLTMRLQPIIEWRNQRVYGEGGMLGGIPRSEMFVQTFSVDEAHRRQGYGRMLQQAGLDLAESLGCTQVRSWSDADRDANHALKISMGFDANRASFEAEEIAVSGAYFVKTFS